MNLGELLVLRALQLEDTSAEMEWNPTIFCLEIIKKAWNMDL